MHSVIFICTGNLHRSPMAEYLFRTKITGQDDDWHIASAGTWAMDGQPTTREVKTVMRGYEISVDAHRAQLVSSELLAQFNLILVMASNHKEALMAEFPSLADRIYLLSEMVGKRLDVEDPIGGPLVEYEYTAKEIEAYLAQGFDQIVALSAD